MYFKRITIKILILFLLFGFSQKIWPQNVKNEQFGQMLIELLGHSVEEITVVEILENKKQNYVFLDARAQKEYEISHLKDAIWVGYDDFSIKRLQNLPKDAKIIVYCSVGYRSEKVSEKLLAEGYADVANLYGGIFEWSNAGQKVYHKKNEKEMEEETQKIHTYNKEWSIWLEKGEKWY